MAITVTNKVASVTASTATEITSSFTTVTGNYYLVSVTTGATGGAVTSVTSTNGVTYTLIRANTTGNKHSVYGGLCTSGGSGTVTINQGASTISTYSVDEVSGQSTTSPISQSAVAAAATVTLATINGLDGTFLSASNTAFSPTIEAGWTQVNNNGSGQRLLTGYKAAGDNTPSFTGSTSNPSIIGIEFNNAISSLGVGNINSGAPGGGGSSTMTVTSFTSVTGQLYLLSLAMQNGGGTVSSVSTGNGIAWTLVDSHTLPSSGPTYLYYGVCTAGATGTITVNGSGMSGAWVLDTVRGAATTSPIVQSAKSNSTSSPLTQTLSAFANSTNITYGSWVTNLGVANSAITKESTWTNCKSQVNGASSVTSFMTNYILAPDTTPSVTFNTGLGASAGAIVIEIAVPPTIDAFTTTVVNSLQMMGVGI